MNPVQLLTGLAFVLAAGGRLTVARQQHGGHPYAGSSMQDNLAFGLINLAVGLAFVRLAQRDNLHPLQGPAPKPLPEENHD